MTAVSGFLIALICLFEQFRQGKEWADEKLKNNEKKEIESATSKATKDSKKLVKTLRKTDISQEEDSAVRYTSILLRGRHLRNPDSVSSYLREKGLSEEDVIAAEDALESTLQNIEIPESILRRNPTVDPIKQNTLYRNIKQNPEIWIIGSSTSENGTEPNSRTARLENDQLH
ncbi:hypothetical protein EL22_28515 [Halostagnicola sp. A56]|uniref:hypothetical protein n=1 Tax=Halostagnicola sp. A56 TaxID=1495067 RepID=UPI00065F6B31|nr:hypothetical protein [Halostagnicola sp. A56]KMT45684.1 hypothetical protein EL22_28515 [Halostagnicola sp. A56]